MVLDFLCLVFVRKFLENYIKIMILKKIISSLNFILNNVKITKQMIKL